MPHASTLRAAFAVSYRQKPNMSDSEIMFWIFIAMTALTIAGVKEPRL